MVAALAFLSIVGQLLLCKDSFSTIPATVCTDHTDRRGQGKSCLALVNPNCIGGKYSRIVLAGGRFALKTFLVFLLLNLKLIVCISCNLYNVRINSFDSMGIKKNVLGGADLP